MVIENKAGAGGNVGTAAVVQAPADGYTLLVTSSAPIAINGSLYKKLPFDAARDLVPVTNVLRMPLVLVVNPASGINDLAGLMAYVRSKPEGVSIANSGNGTPQHLTAELFRDAARLKLDHVPMMFDSLAAIMPHIKSGKVKAGTPQPVVDKLNAAALQVMKTPEFQRVLNDAGSEFVGDTPAHFAQFVKAETVKWDRIVKQSGATLD